MFNKICASATTSWNPYSQEETEVEDESTLENDEDVEQVDITLDDRTTQTSPQQTQSEDIEKTKARGNKTQKGKKSKVSTAKLMQSELKRMVDVMESFSQSSGTVTLRRSDLAGCSIQECLSLLATALIDEILKDVILPRVLNDPTVANLNTIIHSNNAVVVSLLKDDSTFIQELFGKLKLNSSSAETKKIWWLMVNFHKPVISWHLILATRVYATNMRNWKASNFQWRMQPTVFHSPYNKVYIVGNMYTASLYAAFASLLHNKHDTLFTPEKFVEIMKN